MEKTYFITREDFINLKTAWKSQAEHSASDMVIYNVLRSKPAASGFVPKTKNIQGNDPWHAFNTAKSDAHYITTRTRVYIKSDDAKYGRWEDLSPEDHNKKFKEKWGIDLPMGLADLIKESKHD